ncbi:MAG: RdgB/HAM1 family non-canonical purine NTP pyrophosphatase, partial [Thaumarchaeota archaeon]|nr:RdgB/HAM1 family non-canonical purine NTP pyrophosphatase [Nitrososphaerota archaeon]
MPRLTEFFFLTSNDHKIEEARAAVSQYNIEISKFEEFRKLEIQHVDLEEIANTALAQIIQKTYKPVFVEDSGLFIHHLNGFPGPYSSYVFETLGVEGVLKLMQEAKTRKAEFRSSVAFGMNGKWLASFSSATEGTIQPKSRGTNGFGFDPIFIPMWTSKTFAEMELKEKTVYSHRAKAISKLALWYLNESKRNLDLKLKDTED